MPYFFALLLLLATAAAPAQVLDDYQAVIKVENQSPAARDKALREGLAGVLARVSGQNNLSAGGRTAAIMARASALVHSVAYQTDENNELLLVAVFDPAAVESALRNNGLPVRGVMAAAVDEFTLSVAGIDSTQAYIRVLKHLRAQPGVKSVSVLGAEDQTLSLSLRAEGGPARLAGALGISGLLRRDANAGDAMNFVLRH